MDEADAQSAINEIERVLRNELDDCERALRANNPSRAMRELDDGVTKLKRAVARMRSAL